jgi:hypothetical protein
MPPDQLGHGEAYSTGNQEWNRDWNICEHLTFKGSGCIFHGNDRRDSRLYEYLIPFSFVYWPVFKVGFYVLCFRAFSNTEWNTEEYSDTNVIDFLFHPSWILPQLLQWKSDFCKEVWLLKIRVKNLYVSLYFNSAIEFHHWHKGHMSVFIYNCATWMEIFRYMYTASKL